MLKRLVVLTQQIVFNRKRDPKEAEKREKTRNEVEKQLFI